MSRPIDRFMINQLHDHKISIISSLSLGKIKIKSIGWIYYFRYFKTDTWLRGLKEQNKRNVWFIIELTDDFFSFIPTSLTAKYQF